MKRAYGNIWDLADSHWIVIPTNGGWRADGTNVMGRGLALQAANRFPEIPGVYGRVCRENQGTCFMVYGERQLIFFPVKPLRIDAPHLSWRQPADLRCIKASCENLVEWIEMEKPLEIENPPLIAMPMVGCGNGGLEPQVVLPILEEHFGRFDNVVLFGAPNE
jgi:hypothetical protein